MGISDPNGSIEYSARFALLRWGVMNSPSNKSVVRADAMDPARAAALHAVLGCRGPAPSAEDQLPPFWHLIYFWDAARPEEIGPDGHLKTGGFIPDFGMDQRMWAAGSLEAAGPLMIGRPAERRSEIESLEDKQGRSGPMKFVTIRHDISQDGAALIDRQQLVYRNAQRGPMPKPTVELPPQARCELETAFDEVMLFRYSALTFNGHRIHYDADYCRNTAGYPGLVVHGPLLATLLAQVASAACGGFKSFTYRARSPAFCGETVKFWAECQPDSVKLWACSDTGRLCMTAEAAN